MSEAPKEILCLKKTVREGKKPKFADKVNDELLLYVERQFSIFS